MTRNLVKRRLTVRKAMKRMRAKFQEKRKKLVTQLGGKCVSCGITDYRLLDFDHLDPLAKLFNISCDNLARTWEELETEAAKCQLLCANCHRLKSYYSGSELFNYKVQSRCCKENP